MNKMKTNAFLAGYLVAGMAIGLAAVWLYYYGPVAPGPSVRQAVPAAGLNVPLESNTDFGNWLAAQHAIFADDFEKAVEFLGKLEHLRAPIVLNARSLALFLDGGDMTPGKGADGFGGASGAAFWIINGAALAASGNWPEVYKRFKYDRTQMLSPFRIWASVGEGNLKRAISLIDENVAANASWKNFQKGAVYAAAKNPKNARRFFENVPVGFMNLGDYYMVMAFYKKHGFKSSAAELQKKWNSNPGGMYMANLDVGEDWSAYDSVQKMLAAAIVQNISHRGESSQTDSGLLLLRVAGRLANGETRDARHETRNSLCDSIDYYTGGYFFANGSENYKKYWDGLRQSPVYGPFIEMKIAEKAGNSTESTRELEKILQKSPLFIPAIQKSWRQNMQNGRENATLRILNRALKSPNLPAAGRAYLLRLRAHANYLFGDLDYAEDDLKEAGNLTPLDAGVMGLSARVWAAQNKNLDEAYRYAISLVKAFPSNVENWAILARVVLAKEGDAPALEILERIGRVAEECSELFFLLGDLRAKAGEVPGAAAAYKKAIALSGDGLVIKDEVERKLRRLK